MVRIECTFVVKFSTSAQGRIVFDRHRDKVIKGREREREREREVQLYTESGSKYSEGDWTQRGQAKGNSPKKYTQQRWLESEENW